LSKKNLNLYLYLDLKSNFYLIFLYNFHLRYIEFDGSGKKTKKRHERMDYLPYAEKMHKLSCDKRKAINDKKKNYCQELLKKLRDSSA
jgi:hypothetical protein